MSANIDRAARAMDGACCGGCCGACDFLRLARALADAGLLAPDLPEVLTTEHDDQARERAYALLALAAAARHARKENQ